MDLCASSIHRENGIAAMAKSVASRVTSVASTVMLTGMIVLVTSAVPVALRLHWLACRARGALAALAG